MRAGLRLLLVVSCLVPAAWPFLVGAPTRHAQVASMPPRQRTSMQLARLRRHSEMRRSAAAEPPLRCAGWWALSSRGRPPQNHCALQSADSGASDGDGDVIFDSPSIPPLRLLYEDEHLAVLSKPGGMLMHRTKESRREKIFFLQRARDQLGKQIYLANRIDRGTSGMVLVTFDGETAAKVQASLSSEGTSKEYLCMVRGVPLEDSFDCNRPLTDKDSLVRTKRDAHTTFLRIANFTVPLEEEFRQDLPRTVGAADSRVSAPVVAGNDLDASTQGGSAGGEKAMFRRDLAVSLLVARIFTGRRHQIRRHLQHEALNILGDTSYGKGRINNAMREQHGLPRLMLHGKMRAY